MQRRPSNARAVEDLANQSMTVDAAGKGANVEKESVSRNTSGQGRPWHIDKDRLRRGKLDRMASDIMAEEAFEACNTSLRSSLQGERRR